MSTFVYGVVTSKRAAAASDQSQTVAPPGMTTYLDTLTALVPAEVLALYTGVVAPNLIKTVTKAGHTTTVITNPTMLEWSFGGLIAISIGLFWAGRRYKNESAVDRWDAVRFLVPPSALAAWMLLQSPSVFGVWFPHSTMGERIIIAAFAAVVLGVVTKALGYKADHAPARPAGSGTDGKPKAGKKPDPAAAKEATAPEHQVF